VDRPGAVPPTAGGRAGHELGFSCTCKRKPEQRVSIPEQGRETTLTTVECEQGKPDDPEERNVSFDGVTIEDDTNLTDGIR